MQSLSYICDLYFEEQKIFIRQVYYSDLTVLQLKTQYLAETNLLTFSFEFVRNITKNVHLLNYQFHLNIAFLRYLVTRWRSVLEECLENKLSN